MTREEGKPEAAIGKIVEGRVNGWYKDFILLEQAFVKDNKKTIAKVAARGRRQGPGLRPLQGRPGLRLDPRASDQLEQ